MVYPNPICEAGEARLYAEKIKSMLEYTGVSDCRMEVLSLTSTCRSVRRSSGLGTRTEIKPELLQGAGERDRNESARQVKVLESGGRWCRRPVNGMT